MSTNTLQIKTSRESKAGFTLLFAALVTSLLLSVGLAIFNITLQQFLLASSGRESQFAFYAADTGVECSVYFDRKGAGLSTPFYFPDGTNGNGTSRITCNGAVSGAPTVISSVNPFKTKYEINAPGITCNTASSSFTIIVTKDVQGSVVLTSVESRGYNTCDATNLRRVERGLRVDY